MILDYMLGHMRVTLAAVTAVALIAGLIVGIARAGRRRAP